MNILVTEIDRLDRPLARCGFSIDVILPALPHWLSKADTVYGDFDDDYAALLRQEGTQCVQVKKSGAPQVMKVGDELIVRRKERYKHSVSVFQLCVEKEDVQ